MKHDVFVQLDRSILALVFSAVTLTVGFAQEPAPPNNNASSPKFRMQVTVTDKDGQLIRDLNREDFTIYEDGVKQQIESFRKFDYPITWALIFDTSGSMKNRLPLMESMGQSLLGLKTENEEMIIAQFQDNTELIQDFTRDRQKLLAALPKLYTRGGSAMLDAIVATAEYLVKNRPDATLSIIVVSDGLEKNSSIKEIEAVRRLQQQGIRLYFIALIDEEEYRSLWGKSPADKAKDQIRHFIGATGGFWYQPDKGVELNAALNNIKNIAESSYEITYTPVNNVKDGKVREIKVEVANKQNRKLKVIAPGGRFIPKEQNKEKKDKK